MEVPDPRVVENLVINIKNDINIDINIITNSHI